MQKRLEIATLQKVCSTTPLLEVDINQIILYIVAVFVISLSDFTINSAAHLSFHIIKLISNAESGAVSEHFILQSTPVVFLGTILVAPFVDMGPCVRAQIWLR